MKKPLMTRQEPAGTLTICTLYIKTFLTLLVTSCVPSNVNNEYTQHSPHEWCLISQVEYH